MGRREAGGVEVAQLKSASQEERFQSQPADSVNGITTVQHGAFYNVIFA